MMTETKNIVIDVVSDVMCPWCVIGYKRLEKSLDSISDQVSARINFHPYIMSPNIPKGGQNLWQNTSEKYGMSIEESYASRETFITMGKELGFIFNFQKNTRMYNTLKAHELLTWAEDYGRKNDLKLAMYKAHFTDNLRMDDSSVLSQLAESVGLNKEQALQVLYNKTFSEQVLKEEKHWRSTSVNSVPTFFINQKQVISGAQGIEVLTETLLNI